MVSIDPILITTIFLVGVVAICYGLQRYSSSVADKQLVEKGSIRAIAAFLAWSAVFILALSKTEHFQYIMKDEQPLPPAEAAH